MQEEWNRFCEGLHPAFPHVRLDGSGDVSETERYVDAGGVRGEVDRLSEGGSGGRRGGRDERNVIDRRLYDVNCGYAFRTGGGVGESHLLMGVMPSQTLPSTLTFPLSGEWEGLTAHSSFEGMARYLSQMEERQVTMAVRDYHGYWEAQRRAEGSGKVVVVDRGDGEGERGSGGVRVRAMVFDDSLHENIVDVRDVEGVRMSVEEARACGVVVHHARCLHILQQPDYFIRVLTEAEGVTGEVQ